VDCGNGSPLCDLKPKKYNDMEDLIKTIKKRHEETLEYYQGEILTEGEKKILRSEMAFLLMLIQDYKH